MDLEWREFIKKKYAEYKKIGHVACPALEGELIYFNKHGFNHLTRKGGKPRPISEQIRRLKLMRCAPIVLRITSHIAQYEYRESKNGCAHFWTFEEKIESIEVKVVVRQLGNGRKHFFSIMDCS